MTESPETFLPPPLEPGHRLIVAGHTGSGKSLALTWALRRQRLRGVIIDTKLEPAFATLPRHTIVEGLENVDFDAFKAPDAPDFLIVRPSPDEMDLEILDDFLREIYESLENVVVGIDELYNVAMGSHPAPGITALYTRGRSRRISMIAATQRPAWIPLFCLTEADEFYVFRLNWPADRDRMASVTAENVRKIPVDKYTYWWFKMAETEARIAGPVPLPEAPRMADRVVKYERVRLV